MLSKYDRYLDLGENAQIRPVLLSSKAENEPSLRRRTSQSILHRKWRALGPDLQPPIFSLHVGGNLLNKRGSKIKNKRNYSDEIQIQTLAPFSGNFIIAINKPPLPVRRKARQRYGYAKMYVIKRDGRKEPVRFDKITARLKKLSYGLSKEHCDPVLVAQKVCAGVYKGVTTTQLDELTAETAAAMTVNHPDYALVCDIVYEFV